MSDNTTLACSKVLAERVRSTSKGHGFEVRSFTERLLKFGLEYMPMPPMQSAKDENEPLSSIPEASRESFSEFEGKEHQADAPRAQTDTST